MPRQVRAAMSPQELVARGLAADQRTWGGTLTFAAGATVIMPSRVGLGIALVISRCTSDEDKMKITLRADDGAGGEVEDTDLGIFSARMSGVVKHSPALIFDHGTRLQVVPAAVDGSTPINYSFVVDAFYLKLRAAGTRSVGTMPTGF